MNRVMGLLCLLIAPFVSSLITPSPTRVSAQSFGYSQPSASTSYTTKIVWHDNLDSGWRESRRTGRPMVIFITSARCRYCDAMKHATWRDQGIENRVGKEFVAVQLNPQHNISELSRITVDTYPTTLVAIPQGKVIDHRKGFQPPGLLHELLNRVTLQH